jgi:hypothetical protein
VLPVDCSDQVGVGGEDLLEIPAQNRVHRAVAFATLKLLDAGRCAYCPCLLD